MHSFLVYMQSENSITSNLHILLHKWAQKKEIDLHQGLMHAMLCVKKLHKRTKHAKYREKD